MRRKFMPAIYFLMLLAVPVLLAACGSPQPTATPAPTPTPFDVEQLRSLIQDAVSASSPNEADGSGIKEAELRQLVESALADSASTGLSAE